jgi:predicted transcriptional regulator
MKKTELVYREILFRVIEKKEKRLTQSELSKRLGLSLSIINSALKNMARIGAVKINQRNFDMLDFKKILYFWASIRNLEKDISFKTRLEIPVREIERIMPNILFTAYTAYKLAFNETPADYSEVYLYADELELEEIKKRISCLKTSENNPNLFVLKKDTLLKNYNKIPVSQIFVDLWNLKEWYAREFLINFENKL